MILLIDVAVPGTHVHAIGELARDRDRVVRALGVDDDDLVGPGERRQRVGDCVGLVLRDDGGGDGRHCSGIVYYAVDMEQNEALALYRRTGAYLEGHFRLSSGLHSPGYLQSALVLQHPADAAALGAGHRGARETALARQWSCRRRSAASSSGTRWRARSGCARSSRSAPAAPALTLRRGFALSPGDRVLVVEDVFTTGKSTRETIDVARAAGATVVGAAAIVDRSGGTIDFGVPSYALVQPRGADLRSRGVPAVRAGRAGRETGIEAAIGSGSEFRFRVRGSPNSERGITQSNPGTGTGTGTIDVCAPSNSPRPTTAPTSPASSGSRTRDRCRQSSRLRWRPSKGRHVTVAGAGRTDSGVHALGQVASFRLCKRDCRERPHPGAQREAARRRARAVGRRGRAGFQRALFGAIEDLSLPHQQHACHEPVSASVCLAHLAHARPGGDESGGARAAGRARLLLLPGEGRTGETRQTGTVRTSTRRVTRSEWTEEPLRGRRAPADVRDCRHRVPEIHGAHHRRHPRRGRRRPADRLVGSRSARVRKPRRRRARRRHRPDCISFALITMRPVRYPSHEHVARPASGKDSQRISRRTASRAK